MSGHIVFGQALFEAKRLPEAKTVFETALSLDPENLIALRHLADISRELGDSNGAKGWYERVLQADPRNDEVIAIVAQLGSPASAPTSSPGAANPATAPAVSSAAADAASAPTVELSAEAIKEMARARQDARDILERKTDPATETMNLDTTPTVEIDAGAAAPMEGLEPTSHGGKLDLPTFEPLGLETNAAPGQHAESTSAPLEGLDTISLDVESLSPPPPAAAPIPATLEIPAVQQPDGGLLDLGSFSIGGSTSPAAESAPPPVDTPIDGGDPGAAGELIDLDFGTPSEPPPLPPPAETSVPTMIVDAMKAVVPALQDVVESAAPAMMDLVDTTIPAVVDTVKSAAEKVAETPTVIMEAIKGPEKSEPPAASGPAPRPSQSVPFVTETMAQLYLSQGHRAEAIDIYRKLIEARPADKDLKARLAAIENDTESTTTPAAPAAAGSPVPTSSRFAGSGPSIRSVLRELFGFDGSATYTVAPQSAASRVPAETGSIDMLFSTAAITDALNPLAVAFDGGFVAGQGSIDDLFSGSR
jgi:tetratricopeptide (TPR) repeat protein